MRAWLGTSSPSSRRIHSPLHCEHSQARWRSARVYSILNSLLARERYPASVFSSTRESAAMITSSAKGWRGSRIAATRGGGSAVIRQIESDMRRHYVGRRREETVTVHDRGLLLDRPRPLRVRRVGPRNGHRLPWHLSLQPACREDPGHIWTARDEPDRRDRCGGLHRLAPRRGTHRRRPRRRGDRLLHTRLLARAQGMQPRLCHRRATFRAGRGRHVRAFDRPCSEWVPGGDAHGGGYGRAHG